MVSDPKIANESRGSNLLQFLQQNFDRDLFAKLNWKGNFNDYINIVVENPKVLSNAWMRLYNMIMSKGTVDAVVNKKKVKKYKFFSDHPSFPVFGLEEKLMEFVDTIHAGALGYGPEKRVLLLHGPVGSSKSTICTVLKRGLEEYSKSDDGALYTYSWNLAGTELESSDGASIECPIREEPLDLIPVESRPDLIGRIMETADKDKRFEIDIPWTLCPKCQYYFNYFLKLYDGDVSKVLERIEISRLVFDEKTRKGIGTFQPKDEKNQDATELTGDINFRKLGQIGVDSDPRCFNFDGEFQVANRGMCEFIEVLKLTKEFLYDLLGASQEKQIKPKKFAQMNIDEVLCGHTNSQEFQKLQADKTMEALRDRTIKIDIPYLLTWDDEIKIYKHCYNAKTVKQHIAPHTLEIAALWAILTRLHDPKDRSVGLADKARLYNGQSLSGWTEDKVKELKESADKEGMSGVSARFIQNAVSNVLVNNRECINVFMILKEISDSLEYYSLINNEDERKRYKELVAAATKEYDEIVKDEVQKALIGDEDAVKKLCTQYIDNVMAFVNKNKIENPITGREEPANERLMRSIEEKIDVGEQQVNDFRRMIMMHIGTIAQKGQVFDYKSNPKLMKALQLKLFEDTKDTIKLAKLSEVASAIDPDVQGKIDTLKTRLMKTYGYCEHCASDILQYASSIFARGEMID